MAEVRSQMKTHISSLILPTQTELEGWQEERWSLMIQLSKPSQRYK